MLNQQSKRGFHTLRNKSTVSAMYGSILETIGNTPIVRVNNIKAGKNTQLYVKCEYFNPLSSVKDRLAIAVIEDAEKSGKLRKGMTVVEATSGNTGISLAMVCAQKGYPCVITMAEPFSIERRKVMRALGAKVIVTPAALRGTGMVLKARELSEKHGWFLARQFENESNPRYHANTTGPEILRDFAGKRLDYLCLGYGTGGTFTGVGKVLKAARPETKIILAEPAQAALLSSGKKQERLPDGAPKSTHPAFQPHPIQGWTPDFIPSVLEGGVNLNLADRILQVQGPECIAASLRLAREEGIFTGISGGGSFCAALTIAGEAEPGSVILAILADTGERYLSTPLFANIGADMNDEELAISKSTPSAQLAAPPQAPKP